MTALAFLNWAATAVSFFNTVTPLWLGLTVLLNADRRARRTWLAGGGLLLGGIFFAGHSAAVGHDLQNLGPNLNFWWHVSWVPVIGAPYLWYLVTASYSGVVEQWRHRMALLIMSILGVVTLGLLIARPLPSYTDVIARIPVTFITIKSIPVIALLYPVYSVLCIVLSLLALLHPASSTRFMGDLARSRARPWLIAASSMLLCVCFVFAGTIAWFLERIRARPPAQFFLHSLPLLIGLDLLICILVAVAMVLAGQAIVAYEIFTGKALPRGGLRRYWRRCLFLAAGYGAVMSGSLSIPLDPIYRLLLATVLMTLFYALLSWRSYVDREEGIAHLRPFVDSQRMYERLTHPTSPQDMDAGLPFQALCNDVLGARIAYLIALGPLAPLVGPPLVYPDDAVPPSPALLTLTSAMDSPQIMCLPLDPQHYGGAVWAIPLWSERGLIGILLIGEKRDGGLYTQEEIEIARAAGERLIDMRASGEIARRLMALQRQRLQETQLLDRQTRRILHDDVLPRIHTTMLLLAGMDNPHDGVPTNSGEAVTILGELHQQISNLLHALPAPDTLQVARIGLLGALHAIVGGELKYAFDTITWEVEPDAAAAVQGIPVLAAEVIVYAAREAIRNSARYGRDGDPDRPLHLTIRLDWQDGLVLSVEDDGIGIGVAEPSHGGSGQGLALHSTLMAVVGGTLTMESLPGAWTRVALALPRTAYKDMYNAR